MGLFFKFGWGISLDLKLALESKIYKCHCPSMAIKNTPNFSLKMQIFTEFLNALEFDFKDST